MNEIAHRQQSQANLTGLNAIGPNLFGAIPVDGETALALFDGAIVLVEPEEELLNGAPARELMAAMATVVLSLKNLDAARVARRQSWFHRFTGADLEARLEFELAVRSIGDEMRRLSLKAQEARRAQQLIRHEIAKLDGAHDGNEALILATRAFMGGATAGVSPARLERRLGNLEALHASNRLARAQMALAIDSIAGLLDRYSDIEQLLYPVWQQHALAVAQSTAAPEDFSGQLSELETAQSSLMNALRRNKETT
jgi:hypothetical protein